MMCCFIGHDSTFNHWYDILYAIICYITHPQGMGILFLKSPGGPRGGGYFLVPGYGISNGGGGLVWLCGGGGSK